MIPGIIPIALLLSSVANVGAMWKTVFLDTVGAGTWTVASDFNNSYNSVECIAGGGAGYRAANSYGAGGAGGMYALKRNVSLTQGASVAYYVANGGLASTGTGVANGEDSFFGDSVYANALCGAKGGLGGNGATGGVAPTTGGIGDVIWRGGNGSNGANPNAGSGGGAAGPHGPGTDAGASEGGYGDCGFGAQRVANASGQAGLSGQQWDATHGSGGGGAGVAAPVNTAGFPGGLHGAGGSGNRSAGTFAGGDGRQGLIIVTWWSGISPTNFAPGSQWIRTVGYEGASTSSGTYSLTVPAHTNVRHLLIAIGANEGDGTQIPTVSWNSISGTQILTNVASTLRAAYYLLTLPASSVDITANVSISFGSTTAGVWYSSVWLLPPLVSPTPYHTVSTQGTAATSAQVAVTYNMGPKKLFVGYIIAARSTVTAAATYVTSTGHAKLFDKNEVGIAVQYGHMGSWLNFDSTRTTGTGSFGATPSGAIANRVMLGVTFDLS